MSALSARPARLTLGVLAGWQFYWTATPLSYLRPLFSGIVAAAREQQCNLLLACGIGSSARASDPPHPAWPLTDPDTDFVPVGPWNTHGLIVINPVLSERRSRYVAELRASGHPVLFVGAGEGGPAIVADNAAGIQQAMQHLVGHGHRRIAFIAGSPEDMGGDTGTRLNAYHAGVRAYGLADEPGLVAWGRHIYTGGYRATQELLAGGRPFTAVLCSNDESAMGAMQALREAGRRIPQEVAVIGFDDRSEAVVQTPPLSSIHIPLYQMGYQAVGHLLQRIATHDTRPTDLPIATKLVARQSCGCGVPPEQAAPAGALARGMAEAVLAESRRLNPPEVHAYCGELAESFLAALEPGAGAVFQQTVGQILERVMARGDDTHLWQTALTSLRAALPTLPELAADPARHRRALDLLDQARVQASAQMRRQHRQHIVNQNWMMNRVGLLTARLLASLDETQLWAVLREQLPEVDIHQAAVAFYEADGDDPVAWSQVRDVYGADDQPRRIASRTFPPPGLLPAEQAFNLALLPLNTKDGRRGFVMFDTTNLELLGAIVQQLVGALNSAQLYATALEARRQAEEANHLKSRFLSTVSHELRTPLGLIVGLSDILLDASRSNVPALAETHQHDLQRIHASAQQLSGLIRDVLDMASSDAGQLRLSYEFLDLSEALRVVVETGRQLAQDKGLAWEAKLPASGPWVWGDRTRLRQVTLNLVSNAVKFTQHGSVTLAIETQAGQASVVVTDTGVGIPPEEHAAIFDEFHRSARTQAGAYGGLGLGLAICKRLIDLHGGQIGVRSSGPNGSAFYFSLPVVEAAGYNAAAPSAAGLETDQPVLVLTHRSAQGERLREHLRAQALDVHLIWLDEDPAWLEHLPATPPSAVVLDIGLPPRDGWEVMRVLGEHPDLKTLPVLFYALSAEGGAVLEADHLTRPIGTTELAHLLEQELLPAAGAGEKLILVVDDDAAARELHMRIVQSHAAGYRVLGAANGREALDLLQRERPDLVLLDLLMPELDGFRVLEAMRAAEATRSIPVIVLTGQLLTEKEMSQLNRGVTTVLEKGLFSVSETLAHVEAALTRKRKLSTEAQRLVRRAMAYLHAHYAEAVTREEVARHVGLSDDYLTACFRKEIGMTPIAYLNRYRVNQAKALLADADKSILEVALAVGFSDSGYFSRVFRREVGVSPEAFRRQ